MPKKVLITYVTGGCGHIAAAKAIQVAFESKYPEIEVKSVDVLDYANKVYRKFFIDGYHYISKKVPFLWGAFYKFANKESNLKFLEFISKMAIESKLIPMIKEFDPNIIITTHPLTTRLISYSKQQDLIDIESFVVMTDYGFHTMWTDPEVNHYFVATNEIKEILKKHKIAEDKVKVTGIPVEEKFSKILDKKKIVKELGIEANLFTMLIIGGQFNLASLSSIIKGIQKKNFDKVQFLVVTGRDKTLQKEIENSSLNKNSKVKVFGFIDNLQDLMSVSDIVFSKAGGLTVSECLAKGLPMIVNKVIPGQEEDNIKYLVNQGAGVKVRSFRKIAKIVNDLVDNGEKIEEMSKRAREIGRPNAASDIVDFISKKVQ